MPTDWSSLLANVSATTALVGMLVGFFVGLTGVGGGVLLAPALVWLGIQPSVAVGTDMLYGTVTKFVGTWRNVRAGNVDWAWTRALAMGSVPAGVAGSYLVAWLRHANPDSEAVLLKVLGGTLVLASAVSLVSDLWLKRKGKQGVLDWSPEVLPGNRWKVAGVGAAIGLLVGLTSVGSGSLVAVFLLLASRLGMARLVGTDIAHAMLLVGAASLAHLEIGTVDVGLAANLLLGSVPGVLLGGRLTTKVPAKSLKVGVCALVLLAGLKMLLK